MKDLDLRLIGGYSSKSTIRYNVRKGYVAKEHGAKVEALLGRCSIVEGAVGLASHQTSITPTFASSYQLAILQATHDG